MSFPLTLPVVVNVKPNRCNDVLGNDVCAILDQIDVAFRGLDQLSTEIAKDVDNLLKERETKAAEQKQLLDESRVLFQEKEALTKSLKDIQERGDAAALMTANTQLAAVTQDLEQVNAELTQANADLAQNAQDIEKLRADLTQTREYAAFTFQGVQNNLASTGGKLLGAVNKKRKLDSLPLADPPQWMMAGQRPNKDGQSTGNSMTDEKDPDYNPNPISFNENGMLTTYNYVPENKAEIQANTLKSVHDNLRLYSLGQPNKLSIFTPASDSITTMNQAFGLPMATLRSDPRLKLPINWEQFWAFLQEPYAQSMIASVPSQPQEASEAMQF